MLKYAFGGNTPEEILQFMIAITNDAKHITLTRSKTKTSVTMFGENVFAIRINSRTQCLDTSNHIVLEYVERIVGASQTKDIAHIPLMVEEESLTQIESMVTEVYEQCRADAGKEPFGCCNDHVRCSDAGHCLHLDDEEYWGCYYRKNLEAGRIFYGEKSNLKGDSCGKV
ncbi:MAG: hypothetical protein MR399_00270 [Clostridiales bacterium]|nr:hypothetical protein [Clostridiales bacterium]